MLKNKLGLEYQRLLPIRQKELQAVAAKISMQGNCHRQGVIKLIYIVVTSVLLLRWKVDTAYTLYRNSRKDQANGGTVAHHVTVFNGTSGETDIVDKLVFARRLPTSQAKAK
jgi:hypothetical protein